MGSFDYVCTLINTKNKKNKTINNLGVPPKSAKFNVFSQTKLNEATMIEISTDPLSNDSTTT